MSYEQKNEIETVETTPKALEYITTVSPIVWVCFAVLGLMAFGAISVGVGIGIGITAFLFLRHIAAAQVLEQLKARASAYSNCIGPEVISSTCPEDGVEVIQARAAAWRESLKLSGNPYWNILPLIEFPYNPILYDNSQLSSSWSRYKAEVGSKQHIENVKWHEGKCPPDLKALFANAVLPAPKQEL